MQKGKKAASKYKGKHAAAKWTFGKMDKRLKRAVYASIFLVLVIVVSLMVCVSMAVEPESLEDYENSTPIVDVHHDSESNLTSEEVKVLQSVVENEVCNIDLVDTDNANKSNYIGPVSLVHYSSVNPYTETVFEDDVILIEDSEQLVVEPEKTHNYTDWEWEILAIIIYQEAGGDNCSDDTRLKVGSVFMNRVASGSFPNTFEEVATAKSQYGTLHWTGIKWPDRASNPNEAKAVQRAWDIAERILNGERGFDTDDVIWQAEFVQGSEIVAYQDGIYFCR